MLGSSIWYADLSVTISYFCYLFFSDCSHYLLLSLLVAEIPCRSPHSPSHSSIQCLFCYPLLSSTFATLAIFTSPASCHSLYVSYFGFTFVNSCLISALGRVPVTEVWVQSLSWYGTVKQLILSGAQSRCIFKALCPLHCITFPFNVYSPSIHTAQEQSSVLALCINSTIYVSSFYVPSAFADMLLSGTQNN